jgi:hypothetical protein
VNREQKSKGRYNNKKIIMKTTGKKAKGRKARGRKARGRKASGRKPRGRKARGREARGRKQEGLASCNKVVVLMRAVFIKRQFLVRGSFCGSLVGASL